MIFYEYHLHPEIDLEGMLKTSEKLGWKGVCLVCKSLESMEELKKRLLNMRPANDVFFGYRIETNQPENVQKTARKMRKRVEIIIVQGGDIEVNRAACETSEIDILSHPEMGRKDSGLDYVMAKLAKGNNVAIEFNFRNVLFSSKKTRSDILSSMLENAKLVRKYKTPFVLTSGALEPYDLRSPSELISFGRILGLNTKDIKENLSDRIIRENRKRLGGKWIMPGVEIE